MTSRILVLGSAVLCHCAASSCASAASHRFSVECYRSSEPSTSGTYTLTVVDEQSSATPGEISQLTRALRVALAEKKLHEAVEADTVGLEITATLTTCERDDPRSRRFFSFRPVTHRIVTIAAPSTDAHGNVSSEMRRVAVPADNGLRASDPRDAPKMIEKRLVLSARQMKRDTAGLAVRSTSAWLVEVTCIDACARIEGFGPLLATAAVRGLESRAAGRITIVLDDRDLPPAMSLASDDQRGTPAAGVTSATGS